MVLEPMLPLPMKFVHELWMTAFDGPPPLTALDAEKEYVVGNDAMSSPPLKLNIAGVLAQTYPAVVRKLEHLVVVPARPPVPQKAAFPTIPDDQIVTSAYVINGEPLFT